LGLIRKASDGIVNLFLQMPSQGIEV
jgi:hypothetical protein